MIGLPFEGIIRWVILKPTFIICHLSHNRIFLQAGHFLRPYSNKCDTIQKCLCSGVIINTVNNYSAANSYTLNTIAIDWMNNTPPWDTNGEMCLIIALGRKVFHLTKGIKLGNIFALNTIKCYNFIRSVEWAIY